MSGNKLDNAICVINVVNIYSKDELATVLIREAIRPKKKVKVQALDIPFAICGTISRVVTDNPADSYLIVHVAKGVQMTVPLDVCVSIQISD